MNSRILIAALLCAVGGCARFEPHPISPDTSAAAFDRRDLESPELEAFLKQHLGRTPDAWPPKTWGLDALTLAGFYYHPSLAVARAQWAVAQGGETTAGGRPNPTLAVAPAYNATTAMASPWLTVATLDLPIETAGKRRKRQALAAGLSEAARLNITITAWQVRDGIRSSLLDLVATTERNTAFENQIRLREEILRRQQQLAKSGAIPLTAVLPFRVALEKARLDLADSRRLRTEARAKLAESIGVPLRALDNVAVEFDLSRDLDAASQLTSAQIRRAALTSRADILASLAEYAASQAALELEIAKQYPDVHLQPGYEFDQGDSKWGIGFTIELPVLNQNQGPIAEAKARREETAARFLAVQARVLAEIDRAIEIFRISRENFAVSKASAEAQEKQAEAVASRHQAGDADQSELLSARLEAMLTRTVELDHQIKLQEAIGALESAVQSPTGFDAALEIGQNESPKK